MTLSFDYTDLRELLGEFHRTNPYAAAAVRQLDHGRPESEVIPDLLRALLKSHDHLATRLAHARQFVPTPPPNGWRRK